MSPEESERGAVEADIAECALEGLEPQHHTALQVLQTLGFDPHSRVHESSCFQSTPGAPGMRMSALALALEGYEWGEGCCESLPSVAALSAHSSVHRERLRALRLIREHRATLSRGRRSGNESVIGSLLLGTPRIWEACSGLSSAVWKLAHQEREKAREALMAVAQSAPEAWQERLGDDEVGRMLARGERPWLRDEPPVVACLPVSGALRLSWIMGEELGGSGRWRLLTLGESVAAALHPDETAVLGREESSRLLAGGVSPGLIQLTLELVVREGERPEHTRVDAATLSAAVRIAQAALGHT